MTDHNQVMSQHDRDSRELRELCVQRDAALEAVRKQAERIAELEARVHTCGPTCSKAGCINRRITAERDTLRTEVESMGKAISDFCDGAWWAVDAWKNRPDIKPLFDIDAARKEAT